MTIRLRDTSFLREVAAKSQTYLERCSHCSACGSGCPVAFAMDYSPNQVIRMVQFGLRERVLDCSAIWLCASCEACTARCPAGVDIVRMMDTLREMALREGRVREKAVATFHAAFFAAVREKGRVHEPSLVTHYLLASRDILRIRKVADYVGLGMKLLVRGRFPLIGKPGGRQSVKRIFRGVGS